MRRIPAGLARKGPSHLGAPASPFELPPARFGPLLALHCSRRYLLGSGGSPFCPLGPARGRLRPSSR